MTLNVQIKAALIAAVVAIVLVVLQLTLDVATGIAGVFVMGMAGGILVGDRLPKAPGSDHTVRVNSRGDR